MAPSDYAARNRRDWAVFSTLTFLYAFGFAVYGGIFQNFFRTNLHGTPVQLGILESLRETPGLLTALLAGTLVALAEARVACVALLVCGIAMMFTGSVSTLGLLIAVNVVWSSGFHLWTSVSPAITLTLGRNKEGGRHLGRMAGIGNVAVLVALIFATLAKPHVSYAALFAVAGLTIAVAGVLALLLSHGTTGAIRRPIVIRKRYGLYYLLTFLEGCRRQVSGTFASFVLIVVYHTSVQTILELALLNAVIAGVASPIAGRLIDRYNERKMLTLYYLMVVPVFIGYAVTRSAAMLYCLYVVDSLLFALNMALTTYLSRIASADEMTPSLAMGTTMNHVAAVLVPVIGGMLWTTLGDYRIPFAIGVFVALISLVATQWITVPTAALPTVGPRERDAVGKA